jgi:hypothetical protein
MRVTRGLALSVWCGLTMLVVPISSNAQVYDSARRFLDFSQDPVERTPRLLGMGRLTLLSDVHNQLNLWDFAGNPIGVLDADTASTVEIRPGTSSAAAVHLPPGGTERQNLAGREVRLGYEAWRRADTTSTYGVYGDLATLRSDVPYNSSTVLRGSYHQPSVAGVVSASLPFVRHMRYALDLFYLNEAQSDEYRTFFANANGQYLGKHSDILPPPNLFDPTDYNVSTIGGGAAVSYRLGRWMTAALGAKGSSSQIDGSNNSVIHDAGTGEGRPYYTGELGLFGQLTKSLHYVMDGSTWTSGSEERFVMTLKAGQNQEPFTGRGKTLDRDEHGNMAKGQLRWSSGSLEANVSASGWWRTLQITPPPTGDPESYNYFIDTAANREGADSLALPDSVLRSRSKEQTWEIAYGAAWRFPGHRGLIGLESHVGRATNDLDIFDSVTPTQPDPSTSYLGPDRKVWDVRGGMEYACTPALTGRLGDLYRWDDHDERSNRNEFVSNSLTGGIGLSPVGTTWRVDLGYEIDWISPDFSDPTDLKQSRQLLAVQFRWVF